MKYDILPSGNEFSHTHRYLPDMHCAFRFEGVHARSVGDKWSYPSHIHCRSFEMLVQIEGRQKVEHRGGLTMMEPGDLYLFQPGEPHALSTDGNAMAYMTLHFFLEEPWFLSMMNKSRQQHFHSRSTLMHSIKPSFDRILRMMRDRAEDKVSERMEIVSVIFQLLAGLCKWMESEMAGKSGENTFSGRDANLAQRISTEIELMAGRIWEDGASYGELKGIRGIASDLHMSPSYCHRIFKRVYRMSPRDYFTAILLRKARTLLVQPEQSIESIALTLGYCNAANFSRQFKQWTGISPLSFRQMARRDTPDVDAL